MKKKGRIRKYRNHISITYSYFYYLEKSYFQNSNLEMTIFTGMSYAPKREKILLSLVISLHIAHELNVHTGWGRGNACMSVVGREITRV